MTTGINEACIEICYLVRGVFLVWEISISLLLGRILSPSTGFLPNGRFGGRRRVVHAWWGGNKQDKGGGTFLLRWRIQEL